MMALRKEEVSTSDEWVAPSMKRSRITIDVSPELRRRIKVAAVQNDLSIGEYLGGILEQAVPAEASSVQQRHRPAATDILAQLQQVREQVIRDSKGHLFEDSAVVLRQQREERTTYLEEQRKHS